MSDDDLQLDLGDEVGDEGGQASGDAEALAVESRGVVTPPSTPGLPVGYTYGVTRYADVILRHAFPDAWRAIVETLDGFSIELRELQTGGGGRTEHVDRFDRSLNDRGWAKRNIEIAKTVDHRQIYTVRGHEIDMFTLGPDGSFPGLAVEMQWNNKDPFFDRDLIHFQALHREGVLAAGVIVTRGDRLQALLKDAVLAEPRPGTFVSKYGESSTHWRKLVPRVTLGGGGECPLLLIGIEPERLSDLSTIEAVAGRVRQARELIDRKTYREAGKSHAQARGELQAAQREAVRQIPPIKRNTRKATPAES
jgi:hypothetical protein